MFTWRSRNRSAPPLAQAIQSLKISSAKRTAASREAGGPLWQKRYHDRNIRDHDEFLEKLDYIHQNPVKRNLCARPEDCHPSKPKVGLPGTPVLAMEQLSALCNRRGLWSGNRVRVDRAEAGVKDWLKQKSRSHLPASYQRRAGAIPLVVHALSRPRYAPTQCLACHCIEGAYHGPPAADVFVKPVSVWYKVCMRILLAFLLTCSLCPMSASAQQPAESEDALPTVTTLECPTYPSSAREMRLQGMVKMQVTTDGPKVVGVKASGHPVLAQAAEKNVRTWKFADNSAPTSFAITYLFVNEGNYKPDPLTKCSAKMELPTKVQVSTRW
jgi:hypothetical protein